MVSSRLHVVICNFISKNWLTMVKKFRLTSGSWSTMVRCIGHKYNNLSEFADHGQPCLFLTDHGHFNLTMVNHVCSWLTMVIFIWPWSTMFVLDWPWSRLWWPWLTMVLSCDHGQTHVWPWSRSWSITADHDSSWSTIIDHEIPWWPWSTMVTISSGCAVTTALQSLRKRLKINKVSHF